ncbi:hypothetical protein FI667_g3791, partial [Globisporangium splendens]
MPTLRGATGSDLQTPLLLVGCSLLLLSVMAYFRYQLRKPRPKLRRQEPVLQLVGATPSGVLTQIAHRKDDLNRFIGKLRTQLAEREEQLRYHDQLEEIVTSRVEKSREQDREWRKLMKVGKQIHGKKWDASNGDELSLRYKAANKANRCVATPLLTIFHDLRCRELMELHKDELLEYKDAITAKKDSSSSARGRPARGSRIMQLPPSQSIPILNSNGLKPQPSASLPAAEIVSPQWQSTRRVAGSTANLQRDTFSSPGQQRVHGTAPRAADSLSSGLQTPTKVPIPALDFSKLSTNSRNDTIPVSKASVEFAGDNNDGIKLRKSFEMAFQRQARLAKTLLSKK